MKTEKNNLEAQQEQLDIPVVMFSAWITSNENSEEIIVVADNITDVFNKLERNNMSDYIKVSFDKVRVLH